MQPELGQRAEGAVRSTVGADEPVRQPQPDQAAPARAGSGLAPESYAAAVRRAAPAVVNISTARLVTEQIHPSTVDQLFGDLRPLYRRRMERALGSGVIVDADGHIITNNHVIANADIDHGDAGRRPRNAQATVVGRDPDTDLALLSIKLKRLPVMPLGRSDRAAGR